MSLAVTYNEPAARVEIEVDGLQTAGAALYTIERSTDQVNWTRVRAAINQEVVNDDPVMYFDYEYAVGVTNFYRVRGQDAAEFVAVGTATHVDQSGALGTQTFTLPAGIQEGDLLIAWISARRTAIVGDGVVGQEPFSPSWQSLGWSPASIGQGGTGVVEAPDPAGPGNYTTGIFIKIAGASESNPQVTVAGSPVSCQIAAFRNVKPQSLNVIINAANLNEQDIEFLGLSVPDDNALAIVFGAKLDDWTSVTPPAEFTEIDEPDTTLGNDQGITWAYQIQSQAQSVSAGQFTVTGGSTANSTGWTVAFAYNPEGTTSILFSDSISTSLDVAWLKNPLRPDQNMIVNLVQRPTPVYVSRSGVFDIKGRADPIAVTEVRRSPSWNQGFAATTFDDVDGLLALFATGEVLLLHVPARDESGECPPFTDDPGGYVSVDDVQENRSGGSVPREYSTVLQRVAAPKPELGYIDPPDVGT